MQALRTDATTRGRGRGVRTRDVRVRAEPLEVLGDVARFAARYAPLQVPLVQGFEPEGFLELGTGSEKKLRRKRCPYVDGGDEDHIRLLPSLVIERSDRNRVEEYAVQAQENAEALCRDDEAWVLRTTNEGVKAYTRPVHNTDQVAIKHTIEYDLPADHVMDLYVKLNYTSVVDPYTTSLRSVETFEASKYEWLQAIHTYDPLAFGVFQTLAPRDYVTLDFVDKEKMMLVSKSVEHPSLPNQSLVDNKWLGSERVFRVPFLYAVKAEEIAENRTRLVVIHWADIGGNIGRPLYTALAIINFGNKFAEEFRKTLDEVEHEIVDGKMTLGKTSPAFLSDPLEGGWVKDPQVIFERLRNLDSNKELQTN